MASEIVNASGGNARALTGVDDEVGAQRIGNASQDPSSAGSDAALAQNVDTLILEPTPENIAQAYSEAAQIRDTDTRLRMFQTLGRRSNLRSIPLTEFNEDGVGIKDPMRLFFMMIFYLKSYTPKLQWSDILTAANRGSEGNPFTQLRPNFRQIRGEASGAQAAMNQVAQEERENLSREDASARKQIGEEQESARENLPSVSGSAAAASSSSETVIWPFQTLPEMGEFSKEVNWDTVAQVSTMAEPIISKNNGGGPIEVQATFTYAVGLGSLDDSYDDRGVDRKWWTVEEVMAMAYLAMSLVYPFQSPQLMQAPESADQVAEENPAAQFPVVFMRHWQYFPFLTPFVVKSVRVEADDNQPLIISQPVRLGALDAHITLPAARQLMKVTLNLSSAHYYLAVFGQGQDNADQTQTQTSGATYLQMARTLLEERNL